MHRLALSMVRWSLTLLGLASMVGASAQTGPNQTCIDQAMVQCFDGCNNPLNFQECIIGCAAGGNFDTSYCDASCFNDPTCIGTCRNNVAAIATCAVPNPKLMVTAGVPVFNRASGAWQQVLRLTNKTLAENVGNIAVVLAGSPNGWNLASSDGTTAALAPAGSAYKNVSGVLAPGASVQLLLVYSRTGTLPFVLVPQAYSSSWR